MAVFHSPQAFYLLQEAFLIPESPATTVLIQIFTALVIGLLIAFAFQLLLTILGIAIGISALGMQTASEQSDEPSQQSDEYLSDEALKESGTFDSTKKSLISKIGITAGFGILITVNFVLFTACFLAVRFSQVHEPEIGAIEGIVIWSAYFLILLWISSNTVTSILGTVLDLTAGGVRRLVSTIAAAFRQPEEQPPTEAELIDRIRQEIRVALTLQDWQVFDSNASLSLPDSTEASDGSLNARTHDTNPRDTNPQDTSNVADGSSRTELDVKRDLEADVGKQIVTYLYTASAEKLTPKRVKRQLKAMLQSIPLEPGQNELPDLDRTALAQLLAQRSDLSNKQKKRVMQKIEATWIDFAEERAQLVAAQLELEQEPESQSALQPEIASAEPDPRSLSQITARLFHTAAETTLNRALANLPDLLPQLKATLPTGAASSATLAPMALTLALTKVREAVDTIEFSSLDSELLQQGLEQVTDISSTGFATLNHSIRRSVVEQMEQWRDRSIQQIDSIQQLAQAQLDALTQQTQARIEATRKAAALAAWWLFLTASTAAFSAGIAGALGAGWRVTASFLGAFS